MNKKLSICAAVFACTVPGYIKSASQERNLKTQLIIAVQNGCELDVRRLLDQKVNVDFRGGDGDTPLHCAVRKRHKGIVRMLLGAGAYIDRQNVLGRTPLLVAANKGYKGILKILLNAGADINHPDLDNSTSLALAVEGGHRDIVQILLRKKADMHCASDEGWTPLHEVTNPDIMRLLLRAGSKVNCLTTSGDTPLHCAAECAEATLVQLLLEAGAALNYRNNKGQTPLICAIEGNEQRNCFKKEDREEVVRLLLSAGAGANHRSDDGKMPLFLAVNYGYKAITEMLLERGAHWPNPEDYVQGSDCYNCALYLQESVEGFRDAFNARGEALAVFFEKLDNLYNVHGDPASLVGLFADVPKEHRPKGTGENNNFKRPLKKHRTG